MCSSKGSASIAPEKYIRDNANLLILFKQDGTNLKRVYNDHVNTDMSYEDFSELCRNCWQKKYEFLVIDKVSALINGRYREVRLTSLRYREAVSRYRYSNVERTSTWLITKIYASVRRL